MFLLAVFQNIKNIVAKNRLFVLLIIAAAFLRLYRLGQFATFLSDQGRDAIIIKRILALEHLPAIGAPSSLGQVYLGPFYYYFIAPFLTLFKFQPVGLAFGVALTSIFGMIASYFIISSTLNRKVAIFFSILLAFSYVNIDLARFSWNPNLLPLFAFLTLYLFYQTIVSFGWLEALLFGAFFSFSIQLHYLALFLFLPVVVIATKRFIETHKKRDFIKVIFLSVVSFAFFSSPLLIFDLRHGFINSANFIKMFTEDKIVSQTSSWNRLLEINQSFFLHLMKFNFHPFICLFLFVALVGSLFFFLIKVKNNLFLTLHLVNFILFIAAFSFLNSPPHPHYFGVIYYSFFLIISYLLDKLSSYSFLKYIVIPLFFLIYIFVNAKNYYFFTKQSISQIEYSKKIADFLAEKIDNKPFNIATWPVEFTEDNFLYFLELKGLIPANRKKIEITDQMFVLCQQEPCQILASPSWNISMFGKAKIDKIWKIEDITIYKLLHEK